MTIQPSVVIWTVICFILLMLILKYLLFNPIFEVMDKRKKRLQDAKKKLQEVEAAKYEHEKRLEIIEADAKIQRENLIKSELKMIQVKSKTELEEARNGRAERLEKAKDDAEKEKEAIRSTFLLSSDEIAKAFADRLTADNTKI